MVIKGQHVADLSGDEILLHFDCAHSYISSMQVIK